jgi:hypothetical protein
MKNLFLLALLFFAFSCNNKSENSETTTSDSTKMADEKMSTANLDYPYTTTTPHSDWQPGDPQHAVNVMKALKAYETNNIPECVSYFGDSVDLWFDYYHQKLPHDSLTGFFSKGRNESSTVSIRMEDWESVISKDKKSEWVTLWYVQSWTDKKGKTDSLSVVNDAKIVNGKIVVLDEAVRHFPAKK